MNTIQELQLTEKAKELLTNNVLLRVAADIGVSYSTIYRYKKDNPEELSTIRALKSIEKHTGLKQSEIFTEV